MFMPKCLLERWVRMLVVAFGYIAYGFSEFVEYFVRFEEGDCTLGICNTMFGYYVEDLCLRPIGEVARS